MNLEELAAAERERYRERVTYVMSINTDKDYNHFFTYHQ